MSLMVLIQEIFQHIVCNSPSGKFFSRLRWFFFRNKLGSCLSLFSSATGLVISSPKNVSMGKNVSFNTNVILGAGVSGKIIIGNNCIFGPYVVIRAEDHCFSSLEKPIRDQGHNPGKIIIEDDCWICAHVTITRNVKIGKGSVVGANSVVTKNIPPYSVAAGNPAKVIYSRLEKN